MVLGAVVAGRAGGSLGAYSAVEAVSVVDDGIRNIRWTLGKAGRRLARSWTATANQNKDHLIKTNRIDTHVLLSAPPITYFFSLRGQHALHLHQLGQFLSSLVSQL